MKQKEMNHFNSTFLRIGLLLMLVIFVGCTTTQSGIPENESTLTGTIVTPVASATIIPSPVLTITSETPKDTATPAPSIAPKQTITETPLPTKTTTSTVAPTLTPLPTIPPSQRGQVYSDLMSNNGDCTLPCWWGFELGKTSLDEVRQLYISFDTFISEQTARNRISVLEATFVDPQIENGIQVRHVIYAQNNLVTEAEIQVHYQPNYQIEPILEQLGPPSDVWMWTIPEPYQELLPARFRLYYPEQGVFVGYATDGVRIGETVNICFDGPGSTALLLWDPNIWDPDGIKDIGDRANEGGSTFTLEGYPIDEVSNWDFEQFYTFLVNPAHTECLETPSNLWPSP